MMMTQPLTLPVDVIMERVPLGSRWASERWQPIAVELAAAVHPPGHSRNATPGTQPCEAVDESRWRCRGFEIELHRSEAEGYFLNLTSPDPRVFVLWRMFDDGRAPAARPVVLTDSYTEAGRFMAGGEQVAGVALPPQIADSMRAFVAVHYKPEPRRKVKRNDPFADDTPKRTS
jgi:hypothetical protein